jgi:hypothetical protein
MRQSCAQNLRTVVRRKAHNPKHPVSRERQGFPQGSPRVPLGHPVHRNRKGPFRAALGVPWGCPRVAPGLPEGPQGRVYNRAYPT